MLWVCCAVHLQRGAVEGVKTVGLLKRPEGLAVVLAEPLRYCGEQLLPAGPSSQHHVLHTTEHFTNHHSLFITMQHFLHHPSHPHIP